MQVSACKTKYSCRRLNNKPGIYNNRIIGGSNKKILPEIDPAKDNNANQAPDGVTKYINDIALAARYHIMLY